VRALPAPGAEPASDRGTVPGGDDYLAVRGLTASYSGHEVLHGVDLAFPRGIVMALVGESGSGKTTLARVLGGLHDEATGEVTVGGEPLRFGARHRTRDERRAVQYIFQNAGGALNPRKTIGQIVGQPLEQFLGLGYRERSARAAAALADGIVVGSRAVEVAEEGPDALRRYTASLRAALDTV
jgi:peptide/nickel transport system ATP-binding protein